MNYFEKVAKEVKKDSDVKQYGKAVGGAAVANTASALGVLGLSSNKKQKLTDDEIHALARQQAKDIGFKDENAIKVTKIKHNIKADSGMGRYTDADIRVGDNEFIVRHKLGHIKDNTNIYRKQHDKVHGKGNYLEFFNNRRERDKLLDEVDALAYKMNADKVNKNRSYSQMAEDLDEYYDKMKQLDRLHHDVEFKGKIYKQNAKVDNEIRKQRAMVGKTLSTSLHSKAVRDAIREKNDGKVKAVDKAMDVMDNPFAASAILGTVNNSGTLKREFAASLDATKGMVSKYGRKKGLAMSLPLFATQMGSYVSTSALKEGLKGGVIRGGEAVATKASNKLKESKLEKKASYKELIYKEVCER